MSDISVFSLFSIGIGPSSSHTVGPMRAANAFLQDVQKFTTLTQIARLNIELFGSLAFTGKGHGTDKAILLGLEGYAPDTVDPAFVESRFAEMTKTHQIKLANTHPLLFNPQEHYIYHFDQLLPKHSNGMRLSAYDSQGKLLGICVYYSIGGGFIINDQAEEALTTTKIPYPFATAKELLQQCEEHSFAIHDLMYANESALHPTWDINEKLDAIIDAMQASIECGCQAEGKLPGALQVNRRAAKLREQLLKKGKPTSQDSIDSMDWLNLYAIAVNEANASGERVVTAPTNGAAGIIPAVLTYYDHFYASSSRQHCREFLLTAGAIAILYKKGASISGAEVGCQGEVGVACSMAAGALTAVLGGTLKQIANAAEIGMEHHLGMTCDPIGGLVQIPCIERNAMGAVKAVNATRLALLGDGHHFVSLDNVIKTMKQTGEDMKVTYKETSQAGLAVNTVEC